MRWPAGRLGDVVTLQRGHDLPSYTRQDGNVPVVSSSGITGYHNESKARAPGVVTGRYGTLGEVFYLDQDYWPLNTALYVTDFKGNVPKFVAYFLKHVLLSYQSDKAAVPGVDRNVLHEMEVRTPDRDAQQRITDVLSAYDDLIENNRRRMALLEKAARLLYEEWFVRLRFPGHERAQIVGGTPDGWVRTTVGAWIDQGCIDLQTGPFGTQLRAAAYADAGTPVVNVRNIGYGDLRTDKLEFVPEEVAVRLAVHLLQAGDIVFGRKGAVDRHVLIGPAQAGWMQGSDCIRLRALSNDVRPLFLSFAFREPAHKEWMLVHCSNKATMASLNQEVIGRIPLLAPSCPLLEEFCEFSSHVVAQIANLQRQSEKAMEARDLLLPRLMSGEIAV
jgi:type I restriction enzyme, S subunit